MTPRFVHLNLHTEYSLVDGLIKIPNLMTKCQEDGLSAIAVTDSNNLFCAAKLVRSAEEAGIKPIVGAEVIIYSDDENVDKFTKTFLCQDRRGFENLCELLTSIHAATRSRERQGFFEDDLIKHDLRGLICLAGDLDGDIGKLILAGKKQKAVERLRKWRSAMQDRYLLQISRIGRQLENRYIKSISEIANEFGIALLATNRVRFLEREDFEAHDARVCIQESRLLDDKRRTNEYSKNQFLRNESEMCDLFADIPTALENTVKIAVKCNLNFDQQHYLLPRFPIEEELTEEELLRSEAESGLEVRIGGRVDPLPIESGDALKEYKERLDIELEVIIKMGFSGYFLIVADFINWAKQQQIPVGPGRGSGAGSLVAYALGITELDPMKYDLLFERFLNPERVSMPDFDIDFCMDRRDEVINYVARRHGEKRVAQIITFGKMAAKAVIRDVGRILGYPYPQVDELAKIIPVEPGITLPRILEDTKSDLSKRYKDDDDARTIIDLALKLEGIARNAGTHAGGLVIAPSDLTEFTPLYCEKDGDGMVTQFDMGDIESIGLVKFDLLGLRTLTIIDMAVKSVNNLKSQQSLPEISIETISLDDDQTFKDIRKANTTAVFQLESRGMRDLILRLKPDSFEDLIALVALFRPGPLESGMVDDFISVKHGRAAKYPHPLLQETLKPTYGVILYQEQVMEIARSMAGYTLGAADILRRAMGKKKPEEMAKQRKVFLKGADQKGVDKRKASLIFDLIEKFAGYGFNKSHSAAYALIAYQTAWLKIKYPAPFMAAVLSADMDNTDKTVYMIQECRALKLEIYQPDINESDYRFRAYDFHTIRYGLGAIKGLGSNIIDGILEERKKGGRFVSSVDLCKRVKEPKLNRRSLEVLIKSGALDSLHESRSITLRKVEYSLQIAEQDRLAKEVGQADFFGLEKEEAPDTCNLDSTFQISSNTDYSTEDKLAGEKESLGLYLTGHPIDKYSQEVEVFGSVAISNLKPGNNRVAGLITGIRTFDTRRGKMAVVTVDDKTGITDITVTQKVFEKYIDLLIPEKIVLFGGRCVLDKYTNKTTMQVEKVSALVDLRERHASHIVLEVTEEALDSMLIDALREILEKSEDGNAGISVSCIKARSRANFRFGDKWKVRVSADLIDNLKKLLPEDKIRIAYNTELSE